VSDDGKQLGKAAQHQEQSDEVEAHKRAAHDEQHDEAAGEDEVEGHYKRFNKKA
jgi:hypothetical protein